MHRQRRVPLDSVALVSIVSLVLAYGGWRAYQTLWADSVAPHVANEPQRTDFEVYDARGAFVADLRPDECEVVVDGSPRPLLSLADVNEQESTSAAPTAASATADRPGTNVPVPDRTVLVAIDDLALSSAAASDVGRLLGQLRDLFAGHATAVGLVSTGPSSIAVDLTYDFGKVQKAIDAVQTGALLLPARPVRGMTPASISLATLRDAFINLGRLRNRRKLVILISAGFPLQAADTALFNDLSRQATSADRLAVDPELKATPQSPSSPDIRGLLELAAIANRSNVVVLGISPHSDRGGHTSTAALAQLTGGEYVDSMDSVSGAIESAMKRFSYYYVGAYAGASDHEKPGYRRLEVRVKRPDVVIRSRWWY
jgi:VWFA-related protein